jgi:hypothetical protein
MISSWTRAADDIVSDETAAPEHRSGHAPTPAVATPLSLPVQASTPDESAILTSPHPMPSRKLQLAVAYTGQLKLPLLHNVPKTDRGTLRNSLGGPTGYGGIVSSCRGAARYGTHISMPHA